MSEAPEPETTPDAKRKREAAEEDPDLPNPKRKKENEESDVPESTQSGLAPTAKGQKRSSFVDGKKKVRMMYLNFFLSISEDSLTKLGCLISINFPVLNFSKTEIVSGVSVW